MPTVPSSQPESLEPRALVRELSTHYLNQPALAHHLLTKVAGALSVGGPCSLIRLNRFMSERDQYRKPGRIFDTEHIHAPSPEVVDLWLRLSNFFGNPIEKGVYQKFKSGGLEYGATHYLQIFPRDPAQRLKTWKLTNKGDLLYKLAESQGVNGLAYFWVRCAEDDLWFFSLRRKKREAAFTDSDASKLYLIAQELYEQRPSWYCRPLRYMSPKDRGVVGTMSDAEYSIENGCRVLGMPPKTYVNHQVNIYKRLRDQGHDVKSRESLLQYLLDKKAV